MNAISLTSMGSGALPQSTREAEQELIRRFLSDRDPVLFAELIRPYEAPVHRLVAATLGPRLRSEVDDCVQDIFIHVFHKLSLFRFESRFSSWLYSVARNRALDLHRSPRIRRPHVDESSLAELPALGEGPESAATSNEQANLLRSQVEALDEPQRSVVLLFYWAESSVAEIGEVLGMKSGTVKSHLHRARSRLQGRLGERA